MKAKTLVMVLYLLALLAAAEVLVWKLVPRRATLPAMHAVTELAAGQVLSTGDIRLGNGPRYLRRHIAKGDPISEKDLGTLPVQLPAIEVNEDSVPVIMTIANMSPRAAPAANSRLWICSPATGQHAQQKVPVTVQSVLCGERGGATCAAIVDLPRTQAANVSDNAALSITECK